MQNLLHSFFFLLGDLGVLGGKILLLITQKIPKAEILLIDLRVLCAYAVNLPSNERGRQR